MKTVPFLPTTEAGKRQWFDAFKTNLPQLATNFGLSANELQEMDDFVSKEINHIDEVYRKNTELDSAAENRNEHRGVFYPKLINLARHIKSHKNYTKAFGETISIENNVSVRNPKAATNTNKLTAQIDTIPHKVTFKFKRNAGHSVHIYSRRAPEAEFSLLAAINGLIYEDNRSNINNASAEKREYYFVLTKNDKEVERSLVHNVAVLM